MGESDVWKNELDEERRHKDDFMARHRESPFISARVPFHELRYFPPDTAFRVRARLERLPVPAEAYLRTSRDGSAVMRYLGELHFTIGKSAVHLRLYHAGEGVGTSVFVPFRDSTSGRDSYGPGRYLTLELNESDEYDLDFNRAFNPYCAYTDDFECAFPPAENDLPVAIRAGEKVWAADKNPAAPSSIMIEAVAKYRAAKSGGKPAPKPSMKVSRSSRARPRARPAKAARKAPASRAKSRSKGSGKAPRSR
ncbi:MAG: DUF1684 domain-containing protein [Thermoplasmata archaeon]|nr:DUF1684 domain-containing protein [Thermoplasmata archaeon]